MRKLFFFILLLSLTSVAHAGFYEVSATGNYRKSFLDKENFQESLSYTGSISYYFWEMSALELSYTLGRQIAVLKTSTLDPKTVLTTDFEMFGLDLVFTLASKEDAFLPYIKLGGAHLEKSMTREREFPTGTSVEHPPGVNGWVPSLGVGFKIRMTQTLSIKIGADAWSSPLDKDPVIWDYAGRAGLSWMF